MDTKRDILQFEVSLADVAPRVWRRIEVPASYSFWDLHVAVQDAMGWLDYHLHLFRVLNPVLRMVDEIGIPDEDGFLDDPVCLAGWKVPVSAYFHSVGTHAEYAYDFGDGWEHEIELVSIARRPTRIKYPRCVAGERACPPEDCGGPHGYAELLKVLKNRRHKEHTSMVEWLGRPFDASVFDPSSVRFDNPKTRWRRAFGGA